MTAALIGFNTTAVVLTLLGGSVPFIGHLFTRRWLWRMFSLRSGVLLSEAFVEILPQALSSLQTGSYDSDKVTIELLFLLTLRLM